MIYDTANSLEVKRLYLRIEKAIARGQKVKVEVPELRRTIDQNSYLHLIISYLASQIGESLEYVKRVYYKKTCNPEIFVRHKRDMFTEQVEEYLRSSKDLSVEEMSTSIERFKNWSAMVAEIPLPDAEKPEEVAQARYEIEKAKNYV